MPRTHASPSRQQAVEYAAAVHPGLEEIAGHEIAQRLEDAKILDTRRGWVVLSYAGLAADLLTLRTTEDVFAVLFRTDRLPATRQAGTDLLARMARGSRYWSQALGAFYQTRQRSVKRTTFRVIAQMSGQHGFRRQEARDAIWAGVQVRWPGWKPVADDAHLEIWAPIVNDWALIALRLSNRTMRHRTYKDEHRPASLRPTIAAAMVLLTHPHPQDRFCDPMCGAGTILAERALAGPYRIMYGGDLDPDAVETTAINLARAGVQMILPAQPPDLGGRTPSHSRCTLSTWDAGSLPLRSGSLNAVACNLPFGEQIGSHAENQALYARFFHQLTRLLAPGGRAVLLTSEKELVRQQIHAHPSLHREQEILIGVLGRAARIYVLRHG
jgi:tRNA (guanine6-N2)-methyltransferase